LTGVAIANLSLLLYSAVVCGANALGQEPCVVPEFVVPIADVKKLAATCETSKVGADVQRLIALRSLASGWRCEAVQQEADHLARQIGCLIEHSKTNEGDLELAKVVAAKVSASGVAEAGCSEANRLMETAASNGSGEAAFILANAFARGRFRGVCAPIDINRATRYMERAALAGVPRAQADLATALIASRDKAGWNLIRDPGAEFYESMGPFLSHSAKSMTNDEIITLLTKAADRSDLGAIWVLSRIYALGIFGHLRPDLALAWSALHSPKAEDGGRGSDFKHLYDAASRDERMRACSFVNRWSTDSINFRFLEGEIKNPFVLKCIDKNIVIIDGDCLDRRALTIMAQFLSPSLLADPECNTHTHM